MGCACCKKALVVPEQPGEVHLSPVDAHLAAGFAPLGFSELSSYFSAPPHFFILGRQSAGKTSLFVRLAYPEIPEDDAIAVVAETTTYHVESVMLFDRRAFLWDLSGDPALMRPNMESFRPAFVRGIIWVASMLDVKKESIAMSRRCIGEILADSNLATGFFVLLFNTYDLFADEEAPFTLTLQGERILQFLFRSYNVGTLLARHNPRMTWAVCNVKCGWNDPRFRQCAEWIYQYINTY